MSAHYLFRFTHFTDFLINSVKFIFFIGLCLAVSVASQAATWTVANNSDSGAGSLRQAITDATTGDTINFSISSATITLNTLLNITKNLTIDGTSQNITISGGGVVQVFYVNSSQTLSLKNLTITGGNNNNTGGGLQNVAGGTVNIFNCSFVSNSATGFGPSGGGIHNAGTVNIANSTFSGNSATNGNGGGIYNNSGTVNIANSTFTGNSATTGGGINTQGIGSAVNLVNTTVAGNTGGAGIKIVTSTVNLANSLVSGNTGGDINNTGTYNDQGNNLIGSIPPPRLGALGNYGGTTQTYALLPGSPAIDAGNSGGCTYNFDAAGLGIISGATIATDQRGKFRVGNCDIGAFESQGFNLSVTGNSKPSPKVGKSFPSDLIVSVTPANAGEPVNGGIITFTDNGTTAKIDFFFPNNLIASGQATLTAPTANNVIGGYTITATAKGVLTSAVFDVYNSPNLIITEIMYDPQGGPTEPDWEWIEIYNAGTTTIDLSNYVIDDQNGIAHASANIASGSSISAGQTAILYNATPTAGIGISAEDFTEAWGKGINLIAITDWDTNSMQLNNAGDSIGLWTSFARYSGDHVNHKSAFENVNYPNTSGWPTNNDAASIYLKNLSADNNVGNNWALSTVNGTTPLFTGYQSTSCCSRPTAEDRDIGSPGPNPQIVINPTTLTLVEGHIGMVSFTLSVPHIADVTIALSPSNTQCSVSLSSFTQSYIVGVGIAVFVTVTGTNDAIDDGDWSCDIITAAATSTDTNYNGTDPANVTVTVIDNDTAGITVSTPVSPTISEPSGTTTFTIKLNSQPAASADVTIPLTTPSGQCSVPASVTISNANWATGVSVTITAQNDDIADGSQNCTVVTGVSTSGDSNYNGVAANPTDVTVSVTDDDTAGLIVTPLTLNVSEPNGTANFNIKLNSQPTANVTLNLSASPTTECTVPATATLPVAAWNTTGVDVTVSAVDDSIAEDDKTCTVSITASAYTTDTPTVIVTVHDNDSPGVTFIESGGSTEVIEGGSTDTYTLTLNTTPSSPVTITITTDGQTEVSSDGTNFSTTRSLTLNDLTAQTITVRAINDTLPEGPYNSILHHQVTSADSNYQSEHIPDIIAKVTDNDAGVVITPTTVTVTEGGSATTYTVKLATVPATSITLAITGDTQVTISPNTLTFANNLTAFNPQTVTVTAIDDNQVEGNHTGTITHALTTGDAAAYPTSLTIAPVTVNLTDNDIAPSTPPTPPAPPTPPTPLPETPTSHGSGTPPLPTVRLFVAVDGSGQGQVYTAGGKLSCDNNGGTCQAVYDVLTTVTLIPVAKPGSFFSSWGGHEKCVSSNVLMTDNILCVAYFRKVPPPTVTVADPDSTAVIAPVPIPAADAGAVPYHRLTVIKVGAGNGRISSDSGIDCGHSCSDDLAVDSLVTLTVLADEYSMFKGWQGDCETLVAPVTLTMTADKNCIAVFDLIPVQNLFWTPITPVVEMASLMVQPLGTGLATIHSDPAGIEISLPTAENNQLVADYPVGTTVTLSVVPDVNTTFLGWSGEEDCADGQVTLTQTMTCVANLTDNSLLSSVPEPVPAVEEIAPAVSAEKISPVEPQPPLVTPIPQPVAPIAVAPILINYPCPPTDNWLNWVCHAQWRTLTMDLVLGKQASLSHAKIVGTIESQGWVSNLEILPGSVVRGGVVTGYITNAGLLENIEFRGMRLEGGVLGGVILNTSKVGGTIKNVSLAAATYLRGGKLAGRIMGNPQAPAWLEQVSIQTGSYLEYVKIGQGVKFGKQVTLGEGVVK